MGPVSQAAVLLAEESDRKEGHRVQPKEAGEVEEESPPSVAERVGPNGQGHGSEGRETSSSDPDDPERRNSVSHKCTVMATSNPASIDSIDDSLRGACSPLDRIWIGSWSSVDGGRSRHREASPVDPDVSRSESPRARGSQTAVCCKWMVNETVPSPPVPGGRQESATAGTDRPKAEPTNPSAALELLPESRSVSKPEPNVSDASKSRNPESIPTAS
ncbi:UNVERIFIED_CONTAM: hypothetical protein K2H54_055150 [Gekko kuhli]